MFSESFMETTTATTITRPHAARKMGIAPRKMAEIP